MEALHQHAKKVRPNNQTYNRFPKTKLKQTDGKQPARKPKSAKMAVLHDFYSFHIFLIMLFQGYYTPDWRFREYLKTFPAACLKELVFPQISGAKKTRPDCRREKRLEWAVSKECFLVQKNHPCFYWH